MTFATVPPIDPLSACPQRDRYADEVVQVVRVPGPEALPAWAHRTEHLATWVEDGRTTVAHTLPPGRIDNDLAGLIAEELFAPGWLGGSDVFERVFTGVVLTSAATPEAAWDLFYRNTLARLDDASTGPAGGHGSLAAYAPIYRHALTTLLPGSVLELGCCFGLLSLRLATQVANVTATDVTPNTVRLLAGVAARMGRRLQTLVCDAARVPADDACYDVVLALHLLEHLHPDHGLDVVREMQRLARKRAVIAVPFEDEPTTAFGHVRVFTLDDLEQIGRASGWRFECYEHHGGWLVLDRP